MRLRICDSCTEEQQQFGVEEEGGAGLAGWGTPQHLRQPHSKLFHRKHVSAFALYLYYFILALLRLHGKSFRIRS